MDHNHTHSEKDWQAIRTEAIESLLNEIDVLSSDDVDRVVKHWGQRNRPRLG
jgi:nitrile hydratase